MRAHMAQSFEVSELELLALVHYVIGSNLNLWHKFVNQYISLFVTETVVYALLLWNNEFSTQTDVPSGRAE